MGGATGLDHTVLLARLDRMTQLSVQEREQLDADVRHLELAALAEMDEARADINADADPDADHDRDPDPPPDPDTP